jgi:hypothetical protein
MSRDQSGNNNFHPPRSKMAILQYFHLVPLRPPMRLLRLLAPKLPPTPTLKRMHRGIMPLQRALMRKKTITDIAIRVAGRFLVALKGAVEFEPLVAVGAAEIVHGIVVVAAAPRRAEKPVAVPAETVTCGALVVFERGGCAEGAAAVVARCHGGSIGDVWTVAGDTIWGRWLEQGLYALYCDPLMVPRIPDDYAMLRQ